MGVDAKPLIFMAKCETRDTELKALDLERETALAKKKSIQKRNDEEKIEIVKAVEECKKDKIANSKDATRRHEEAEVEYAQAVTNSAKKMVASARKYEDRVVDTVLHRRTGDKVDSFYADEDIDDRDELADDNL